MDDRELWFATTVLELSDALDAQVGEDSYERGLVTKLVELLGPAEVGLLVADESGRLHAVAASSSQADDLTSLDVRRGDGPGSLTYRTGQAALGCSLSAADNPWHRYAAAGREAGFVSVSALPVQRRGEVIGAVCVLDAGQARITPPAVRLASVLIQAAATGILQHRVLRQTATAASAIGQELDRRVLTEQATGAVAAWLGVRVNVAADLLASYAAGHGFALADVAEQILRGRLPAQALFSTSQPRF
ncbi:MAG: GAF domain-containing protein [Streptosporangiaceae bacterium]